uniref:Ribonuclease H-like domain-containing protein n=1 Tax=Tanacetum cinerariifolium TaxID=118510 RepID=A0A6L2J9B3_TANCI|nr:ribonuclease H-like domain-containing protein [Tanacetum cinerariifolium]
MDLESVQNNAVAKFPLLKQGDYEMWKLRIEKYFQVQDYALWDVIENGNFFKPVPRTTTNAYGTSTSTILAIQARFGDNDATKKTQKTLLKQMYENFNAPSTESLDSIFNMLQKIVSQLAILGENIFQEDLNMKLLRSLPADTNEVDTANIQVSTVSTSVSTVGSHDNTDNLSDATMYAFLANQPNGSQLVHEDQEQIYEDDLEEMNSKWQLALLSMRARRYFQRTVMW